MRLMFDRRKFLVSSSAGMAAAVFPGAIGASRAATPFNFQASWINDAEFAGYFLAIDKGYYADEGLDMTYFSGGPDVIPESTLISGKADLTLTTPETTITAIVDQGAKFKIIGAHYQKNPIGIVSLAKTPIMEPKDMIGKTIAVPPVNVISLEAVLKLNGIDPAEVKFVPYAYDPTPIVKGEVDAAINFTTNVPYAIEQAGEKATSFLLYDYGFTVYNNTVVVTEETLNTRRAELVSWLRASRKGWDENFVDPALWPPKFADTWFKGTGRTIANEVFFNTAQKPLMEHPDGIFAMDEEGIEKNIFALSEIGIKASRDMFDTTLLEEI
ncbi:ABC transporter substrate-binding protein [Hoeflea sp.]|uniref:ABC transporter substrate-binding protein n=1 Tax=Hoeflea sp. TaxID=1940281 RepID=UPI0019C2CE49|nr:ABC transporter substrate-binding protein [Hoeflea sp.]MBC7284874.1 ABC transporter substrate-binding protein [Hoeflea sp.]